MRRLAAWRGGGAGIGGNHGRAHRGTFHFTPFVHICSWIIPFSTLPNHRSRRRAAAGPCVWERGRRRAASDPPRPPPRGPAGRGAPVRLAEALSVHVSGQALPPSQPGCPHASGRAGHLRPGMTGRLPGLQGPGWGSQGPLAPNKPWGAVEGLISEPVQDSGPRCQALGAGGGGQGRAGMPSLRQPLGGSEPGLGGVMPHGAARGFRLEARDSRDRKERC